jgi:hypothetical protein
MFEDMTGLITKYRFHFLQRHIILDMSDSYTRSLKGFSPFCIRLYYLSNFKDFNTIRQA